ncbi:AAA family ATPase [Kitasatospora sp. NPDC047058]|uniref:AAA family ATPase n=1 Tax=Kitasatospora sp. NPDC047058 TaxID=3155620 RepID=UPI0033DD9F99
MSTTSKAAVIAAEQQAVDRAYACYEAALAELAGGASARAAASGKDGIAARAESQARADVFRLEGENLVTMRVDAQPDGATEPEVFYLGRRTVHDAETRDAVVISWTNKLATAWRLATPGSPGEVRLRRRLDCDRRTVTDYRDEITRHVPAATGAGDRRIPSPGDLFRDGNVRQPAVDDLLLRDLQRSRRTRMRDIVETIQPDQMALVAGPSTDVLVVQGGPGTGKSAVGLHRVTWLVDNKHFRAEDILVVGPHRRFLEYVGKVLPTLGTRDVTAVELPLLWPGGVRAEDEPPVRRVKSGERMAEVLRRRVEGHCRPTAVDAAMTAPADEQAEPVFTVVLGSAPLRVAASEVHRVFEDARNGPGHYRARRDRFRDLLVDRLLVALQEGFPQRARDRTVRRDIERHRQVAALVERAWPPLSPEEALRSLLNSPGKLAECASDVLDAEEQALLRRAPAERAEDEPWTLDDLVCLEELRSLISGETPQRYPHIVVDEAQDLTPMQARSLQRRNPKGSMTVLGDLAQATGPHSYGDWERLGRILAGAGGWHLEQLTTSYRVPAQIMDFVAPLARAVAPSVPFPAAIKEADGDAVRIVETAPWQLLAEAVGHAARLAGSDGRTQRSIALVVPDDSDWLQQVRLLVDSTAEMTEEVREAVTVLTAGEAKGMEFDHVLVLEPATITARGPEGPRQLYVALTRSTQTLTVLHTSPLPAVMLPDTDHGSSADDGNDGGGGNDGGEAEELPVPPSAQPAEGCCSRFHSDGTRCELPTGNADGWCRDASCGGYRTSSPPERPPTRYLPRVPADADLGAGLEPSEEFFAGLRVTRAASQAFVTAHGGSPQEAEAEIRSVLTAFLTEGRQAQQPDGYRLVDLHGYRFVLSPDGTALTGYRSVHGERSPAQFIAGVPSRYRGPGSGNDAGRGPGLDDVAAVRALAAEDIQVSSDTRTVFAGLTPDQPGTSAPGFLGRLQHSLAADLADGHIEIASRGNLMVRGRTLTWTLTPDGRAVVFVRRHTPLDAEIHAAHGLPEADELDPGTALRVRALAHGDQLHWRVTPVTPDRNRRYILQLRPDDPRPEAGTELDVWVVRRRSGVHVVSANDFGRHPVSAPAAERYAHALAVLIALDEGSLTGGTDTGLAELTRLANGCLRRDQLDWLAVRRLLGSPSTEELAALRDASRKLPAAVHAGDTTRLKQLNEELRAGDWQRRAATALSSLRQQDASGAVAAPSPEDVLTAALTAELTAAAEEDRTCLKHEAVRHQLKSSLLFAGHRLVDSPIADVIRPGDRGPVVYEVLPAGRTSYHAVRAGAVRLREIGQLTDAPPEQLYLVLPEPPDEPWIPGLVHRVLEVSVLWHSATGWQGPDSPRATGSPGDA